MLSRLILGVAILCALGLPAKAETCRASWYGGGEYLNRHTANGERFDPRKLTAAHRSLPFGTRVRVTWRGRSVVVVINDRGPAKWTGRCIDLSRSAANAIGMIGAGVGRVTIRPLR
jgi:rare lipoprotein A